MISPAPPPPLTTPILQSSTPRPVTGLYSYLIMGLSNFTMYTITVATYNEDGVGPLTTQATVTTPEAGELHKNRRNLVTFLKGTHFSKF